MFHVEQKSIILWAASVYLGAAQLVLGAEIPPTDIQPPAPSFSLPLATANRESISDVSRGMQELLLGDDEEAARFFTRAISTDEDCSPLAYVGLYLAQHSTISETEPLAELSDKLSDMQTTPPEAFYLTTLLELAGRNIPSAQKSFTARADRYRGDIFSACWSIQLLHYQEQGYDEDGNIRDHQHQALERAITLHRKHPHNALICFLRALVEESAPEISSDALAVAEEAAYLLPDHPTVLHLYGHLLYRSGHFEEASMAFHEAFVLASNQKKELISVRARLYESVALWSDGKEEEALAIRRELNKLRAQPPAADFLKWESRTLPLRILILREETPKMFEINSAIKAALPEGEKGKDPYTLAVLCMKDAVSVRLYLQQKKKTDAIVAIRRAEGYLRAIDEAGTELTRNNPQLITYWLRLHDASSIAINVACKQLYPSTAETWNENIRTLLSKPADGQLPPAVPIQKK